MHGGDALMFTARERQMIRLLIERGLCTKEAAWELHIAESTGYVHRQNIMRKLRQTLGRGEFADICSVDLALYAITHKLVDYAAIERRYAGA